jgi:hypothetical protein
LWLSIKRARCNAPLKFAGPPPTKTTSISSVSRSINFSPRFPVRNESSFSLASIANAARLSKYNALKGRSKHHQNMELVVFNRSTVSTSPDIQVCEVLCALSGRWVIDVTQGRRAKRLPLATFCRASRATGIISLMSYHARLMLEHKPTGVDEPDLIRRSSRRAVQ